MKPKIPSLKFHIGITSSPPSQKDKEKAQRRKSDESGQLPPMKKFKHVEINNAHAPHRSSHAGSNHPHLKQNRMHDRIMSGPTLSPQGQVKLPSGQPANGALASSPPPGLRSPPGPPAYANGYDPRTCAQPPPGAMSNGWLATYQIPRSANTPRQEQPVPPAANPFHKASKSYLPNSSHSPLANGPTLSPPQQHYNFANATNSYPPNTDGLPSQTYSLPPPLPPPMKHQSTPPISTTNHVPSSSPITGPDLHRQAPPSPGFSPTKQNSPRPAPLSHNGANPDISPSLHRKASLSPGISPLKQSSPRPTPLPTGLNDPSSSPILEPALPTKAVPNPGLSPTKQSPPRPPRPMVNGAL